MELNQAVWIIADIASRHSLDGDEATAFLRVADDYSFALDLLDEYDHQQVLLPRNTRENRDASHTRPMDFLGKTPSLSTPRGVPQGQPLGG